MVSLADLLFSVEMFLRKIIDPDFLVIGCYLKSNVKFILSVRLVAKLSHQVKSQIEIPS
jgi:hypothetical protein